MKIVSCTCFVVAPRPYPICASATIAISLQTRDKAFVLCLLRHGLESIISVLGDKFEDSSSIFVFRLLILYKRIWKQQYCEMDLWDLIEKVYPLAIRSSNFFIMGKSPRLCILQGRRKFWHVWFFYRSCRVWMVSWLNIARANILRATQLKTIQDFIRNYFQKKILC